MVRQEQSTRHDVVHATRSILYRGSYVRGGQETSKFHLDRNIPIFDIGVLRLEGFPLPRHGTASGTIPRVKIARDAVAADVRCKTRKVKRYWHLNALCDVFLVGNVLSESRVRERRAQ